MNIFLDKFKTMVDITYFSVSYEILLGNDITGHYFYLCS